MTAYADPAMLREVLENLLGNAWKFTGRREGARIKIAAARRMRSGLAVSLCATTARASTWTTPASCSAPSIACMPSTSSPARAWDWPWFTESSAYTEDGYGRRARRTRALRSSSLCRPCCPIRHRIRCRTNGIDQLLRGYDPQLGREILGIPVSFLRFEWTVKSCMGWQAHRCRPNTPKILKLSPHLSNICLQAQGAQRRESAARPPASMRGGPFFSEPLDNPQYLLGDAGFRAR